MTIEKIHVRLTVLQGSGLVAKDRNLFGKKTTSDPYIEVWTTANSYCRMGKTAIMKKTLDPKWNETFEFFFKEPQNQMIFLKIWDEDLLSAPDAMGTVTLRIPSSNNEDTT
jgi:Ca2+-dependent lipid-binding protein